MVTRHEEAAVPEEERARVWIRSCGLTRWRLQCWDVRSESELQTRIKHTQSAQYSYRSRSAARAGSLLITAHMRFPAVGVQMVLLESLRMKV